MPVEIERKFLLVADSWRPMADDGKTIRQGYIITENHCSVRVRIRGDGKCTLTTKLPRSGVSRYEFEHDIELRDAENLMDLCSGHVVEKTRYKVEHAGDIWEIDVYDGANAGLVVAEIELDREDRDFDLPAWVGEEVTGMERYQNSALARRPVSTWEAETVEAAV